MKKGILILISLILALTINVKTANAAIRVNPKKTVIGIGDKKELDVTGNINDIKMESTNSSVVAVEKNKIVGKKEGIAYITISDGISTANCTVTVVKNYVPVTSISLDNTNNTLIVKSQSQIKVNILPENASNKIINYISSDDSIVSVDDKGIMTANKIGKAYITISVDNKTQMLNVNVVQSIALKGISIPTSLTIGEGHTLKLKVTYNPENASNKGITWKSSNNSIASIDLDGNLKGNSPGSVTITATSNEGKHVAKSNVIVTSTDKTLKSISLNKTELELKIAEEEVLTVSFDPTNTENKKVAWTSSNEEIATVNQSGKVKAIKPGKVEIKAVSDAEKKEAKCTVTVTSLPIKSISFKDEKIDIYEGGNATLATVPVPQNTAIINPIWTSSDEEVATVKDGKVTAKKIGTTTITVSNENGNVKASITVNVIPKPNEELLIEVIGYNLNFNKNKKDYTLVIGNETSLDFQINRDADKYLIAGNRDLKNGSVITITVNDIEKQTYIITIKRKRKAAIYLIGIIGLLVLANLIRIIVKNKKK